MIEITDQEYEEYSNLRRMLANQIALDAHKSVRSLEDDIDTPIKKCVMALALLGCEPRWSCCGFDYDGQPLYKSHQYGRVFFILGNNKITDAVVGAFLGHLDGDWVYRLLSSKEVDLHYSFVNPIPMWGRNDCIHYHEPASVAVSTLEAYLMSLSRIFESGVTLSDTNAEFRGKFHSWQLAPKSDWVIRKEDLF